MAEPDAVLLECLAATWEKAPLRGEPADRLWLRWVIWSGPESGWDDVQLVAVRQGVSWRWLQNFDRAEEIEAGVREGRKRGLLLYPSSRIEWCLHGGDGPGGDRLGDACDEYLDRRNP